MGTLEWEMVALIVTVIGGFAAIAIQIGRRDSDLDHLVQTVNAERERASNHEEHCDKRHDQIDKRLADGTTKMALLDDRHKRMHDDIKSNTEDLKAIKNTVTELAAAKSAPRRSSRRQAKKET